MTKTRRNHFTQYVHPYIDMQGRSRWAVASYDQFHCQYTRPFDRHERKLTGCSAEFARSLRGGNIQNYPTRKQALARARYLFFVMEQKPK